MSDPLVSVPTEKEPVYVDAILLMELIECYRKIVEKHGDPVAKATVKLVASRFVN